MDLSPPQGMVTPRIEAWLPVFWDGGPMMSA
jgi:hypothetical protein